MVEIRLLSQLNLDDLQRLVTGYIAEARYQVSRTESEKQFSLTLELVPLSKPFCKRYDQPDAESLAYYQKVTALGFSFGAYAAEKCVAMALAEPQQWNRSLWVWELHVAESHRRQGTGRQLVEALAGKARATGLRTMVCETQNTNTPALQFYRNLGFHVEGIDLSYYSNHDFPDGEIAIFMKKRVEP